jgi:hypothetical protein
VSVDVQSIFVEFNLNKHSIGQFNKGERRRFEREMDAGTSALFIESFARYYQLYFPEEIQITKGIQPSFTTAAEAVIIDSL